MATNVYDVGDIARISIPFTDDDGNPADPDTVTATVRKPDGTTTAYTVTPGEIEHDDVGEYHLDVQLDQEGDWTYRAAGTGAITDAGEKWLTVRPEAVIGDKVGLTSLRHLRLHVLRDSSDDTADEKLLMYGEMMSERVADYCAREFLPVNADDEDALERVFPYDGSGNLNLRPYDLRVTDTDHLPTVTLFTDRDASVQLELTRSQYELVPRGGARGGTYLSLDLPLPAFPTIDRVAFPSSQPLYYGFDWQVSVAGWWGMAQVPKAVELAVLIAVDETMKQSGAWIGQTVGGYTQTPDIVTGFDDVDRGGLPRTALWALNRYRRKKRIASIRFRNPAPPPRPFWLGGVGEIE